MIAKSQKLFIAKLILKKKIDPTITKTFWIGTRHFLENELYSGSPLVYPILKEIPSGLGFDIGEVLPADRSGSITVDVTRNSLGHAMRLYDYLEEYTFIKQPIEIYSFSKKPDEIGSSSDLETEFKGLMENCSIKPDSNTMTIPVASDDFSTKNLLKKITSDHFPDAGQNLGKDLSFPIGSEVNAFAYKVTQTTNPAFVYATAPGAQSLSSDMYSAGDILGYYAKNKAGNYVEVEFPDELPSNPIAETSVAENALYGGLVYRGGSSSDVEQYEFVSQLRGFDSALPNVFITHVSLRLAYTAGGSGAAFLESNQGYLKVRLYDDDDTIVSKYNYVEYKAPKNVLGEGVLELWNEYANFISGSYFWVKIPLTKPVLVSDWTSLKLGLSLESTKEACLTIPINFAYADESERVITYVNLKKSSSFPTAPFNTWAIGTPQFFIGGSDWGSTYGNNFAGLTATPAVKLYAMCNQDGAITTRGSISNAELVYSPVNPPSDENGFSFFRLQLSDSPSYAVIPDLSGIDNLIVKTEGIKENAAELITGNSGDIIERADHVAKLLYFLARNYSLDGFEDSKFSPADYARALNGAFQKNISIRNALAQILFESSSKLLPNRNGDFSLWCYGVTQEPIATLYEYDFNLESIQIEGADALINSVEVSYREDITSTGIRELQTGKNTNFESTYIYTNEISKQLYGLRNAAAQDLLLVSDDTTAAFWAQYLVSQYALERFVVTGSVPFWKNNYREIQLYDIVEFSHIDAPSIFGTMPADKEPSISTDGEDLGTDLNIGFLFRRAKRYKMRVIGVAPKYSANGESSIVLKLKVLNNPLEIA
jgi:hypothetical protein